MTNNQLDGREVSKNPDSISIDYSLFKNGYASGGTVAPIAAVADAAGEKKKEAEQQTVSQSMPDPTSGNNPNDYIGQWAYDLGKGDINGIIKGPGMRALEKGDIMSAISPAAMIVKGLNRGGPVAYAGGGPVAPAAGIAAAAGAPAKTAQTDSSSPMPTPTDQPQDYGGYELGPFREWAIQVGRDVGAFKAAGGPVHNNYAMAKHLASQGRGRDTTLVHMSGPEVRGLGSLHPTGKMPINPKTGLPEADFLTDILPGIAGTLVGSVVGMPWLGAAVGGLGTWAATGNLGKGILSGLMSFGLGSIGGALGEAGAKTAGEAATKGASDVVAEAAKSAATSGGQSAAAINPATFADPMAQGAAQSAGVQAAGAGGTVPAQGMFGKIGQAFNNPGQAFSNIGTGIMNPQNVDFGKMMMPGIMGASGAYGLAQANQQPAPLPNPFANQQQQYNGTPSSTPFRSPTGGVVPQGQSPAGYQGELSYFAPNPAYRVYAAQGGPITAYASGGGVMPDGTTYELAKGGVANLPSGLIRGPGGGMDDQIKGTIDGRRDVYLSDGEYVVDAQTVSALGDGSSEAGAKKMKNIVEEIRQKKFGSKKQPPKMAEAGGLASLRLAGGSGGI